jgi:periplasmic copper chaperone A
MISRRCVVTAVLLLASHPTLAQSYAADPIRIEHPWARPTAARLGTAYLVLATKSDNSDRLVSAETPVAERVEFRSPAGEPVRVIEILPGEPTTLRPGKSYLALVGLRGPLTSGETFPLTLRFESAGEIAVTVQVEQAPGN